MARIDAVEFQSFASGRVERDDEPSYVDVPPKHNVGEHEPRY